MILVLNTKEIVLAMATSYNKWRLKFKHTSKIFGEPYEIKTLSTPNYPSKFEIIGMFWDAKKQIEAYILRLETTKASEIETALYYRALKELEFLVRLIMYPTRAASLWVRYKTITPANYIYSIVDGEEKLFDPVHYWNIAELRYWKIASFIE